MERGFDLQAELVSALQSSDESGEYLYKDVQVMDAMALMLISLSEQIDPESLGVGSQSLLRDFFKRAGVVAGQSADETSECVKNYFEQHPLSDDLAASLSKVFQFEAQHSTGVVNEAASALAQFTKSKPRVFDAFVENERPQGTFGGGNLAKLALMTNKTEETK